MSSRMFLIILLVVASMRSVFAADSMPRVIFPFGYPLPSATSGSIVVDVPWLQIQLPAGWVVGAARGAQLTIDDGEHLAEFGQRLQILEGEVVLVHPEGSWFRLPVGRYFLGLHEIRALRSDAVADREGMPIEDRESLVAGGYRLSDAVLTQQQKYLDSLRIDVRDINKGLASIIRGLFPKRQ